MTVEAMPYGWSRMDGEGYNMCVSGSILQSGVAASSISCDGFT
jgi:hypothetical protein